MENQKGKFALLRLTDFMINEERKCSFAKSSFGFLFILNIIWGLYLIWNHLNIVQFDHAGHIASAAESVRQPLHHFGDQIFMGYTHGLFYPPLEDFILALLHSTTGVSFVGTYPIYLSIILVLFITSIIQVLFRMKRLESIIFFGFCSLWFFNADKVSQINTQGWALSDLIVIGLSTQFLSGIGFFFLCSQYISSDKNWEFKAGFWTLFSILSHLIVGVIAFILLALIHQRHGSFRSWVKSSCFVLGSCAFFWLPFISYHRLLTTSTIFFEQSLAFEIIAFIGMLISFIVSEKSFAIYLLALILMSSATLLPLLGSESKFILPFHYYRLIIISLFLIVIGISIDLNTPSLTLIRTWLVRALAITFIGNMVFRMPLWNPDSLNNSQLKKSQIDFEKIGNLNFSSFGRYWVFGETRGCDFGLDSLIMERMPEFRSTKGLFWESSYANSVQSSYLATLIHPPVVLDFYAENNITCKSQVKLVDQYVHLFNVKGIIASEGDISNLTIEKKMCYEGIFRNGTNYFRFIPKGNLIVNQDWKQIYELQFKSPLVLATETSNETVETINPERIQFPKATGKYPYFGAVVYSFFSEAMNKNTPTRQLFVLPEDKLLMKTLEKNYPSAKNSEERSISLFKLGEEEYQFDLPEKHTWFFLKFAFQPGMNILNQSGESISLLKGLPGTLGIGSGRMKIRFEKTKIMITGYWLSAITFVAFILSLVMNKYFKEHR